MLSVMHRYAAQKKKRTADKGLTKRKVYTEYDLSSIPKNSKPAWAAANLCSEGPAKPPERSGEEKELRCPVTKLCSLLNDQPYTHLVNHIL